ncbi:MAG: CHAT domain-containing tetratricopeptide repeat protein [Planctomycetota bacterium]|nr:CHAT domain-containing tetratricopeptide repeat protein [Planctomycetota bacterium]
MGQQDVIASVLEALESGTPSAALALLPGGPDAARVIDRACDESERRIMADLSRSVRTTRALVEVLDAAVELRNAGTLHAKARRVHAQALTYANQFDVAERTLRDALDRAEAAEDRLEVGRSLLTLLHVCARQGRFGEALAYGERARLVFEALGDRVQAGRAENNLGIIERMRDRPTEAIEHFERASAALGGEAALVAHVENNRAEALLDLDRFAEAESAFERSLRAFVATGAHRHAGIVLGNLADLASRQGRAHDALARFAEAMRTLENADAAVGAPGDAARLRVEQADVLLSLGLSEEAAEAYTKALEVLERHSMRGERARALLGLGRARLALGDDAAGDSLREAERAFEELGNDSGRARALASSASAALRGGDRVGAMESLDRARELMKDRPAGAAWIDLLRASAQADAGRDDEASRIAEQATDVAEALGISPLAGDLLHVRGCSLRRLGQREEARTVLRRAVEHAERGRAALQADLFRGAFASHRAEVWEDAASAALDCGDWKCGGLDCRSLDCRSLDGRKLDEGFELVEMGKARSLLETLGSARLPETAATPARACDHELGAEVERIRGNLHALYERAWDSKDGDSERRERTRQLISHWEGELRAIMIRVGASATLGGTAVRPRTLSEVRSLLSDDAGVIAYFADSMESKRSPCVSAFVVRRHGATVLRNIASLERVHASCEAVRFQVGRALARGLAGTASERLRGDARRCFDDLGRVLLQPVVESLGACHRLVIVPMGPLHGTPFDAARIGNEDAIDRYSISVLPSAGVLSVLPGERGWLAPGGAVCIGVADERAPRAEEEARTVAMCIRGVNGGEGHCDDGVTLCVGAGATRERVAKVCRGAGLIHVASHARFIASNPAASGLKLSDGWLAADQIAAMDLHGATVVLSGCETGRVRISGADEQTGLARALLAAGAASLIISLWPVHDETTTRLMTDAYSRAMADGRGLGYGLREAQRAMKKTGVHPAAWAAFQRIGRP